MKNEYPFTLLRGILCPSRMNTGGYARHMSQGTGRVRINKLINKLYLIKEDIFLSNLCCGEQIWQKVFGINGTYIGRHLTILMPKFEATSKYYGLLNVIASKAIVTLLWRDVFLKIKVVDKVNAEGESRILSI
jgi:hypothetical protein